VATAEHAIFAMASDGCRVIIEQCLNVVAKTKRPRVSAPQQLCSEGFERKGVLGGGGVEETSIDRCAEKTVVHVDIIASDPES
jgi:hypothetical protein